MSRPRSPDGTTVRRPGQGGDRSVLRRLNLFAALDHLRNGPSVVHDIGRAIGVSRTAAQQIVDELIERRWVTEDVATPVEHHLGRAPRMYRLRSEVGYVAGLDIGRNQVTAVLGDLVGTVVARADVSVTADTSPSDRIDAAHEAVTQTLTRARVRHSQLWMVSTGTRGVVSQGRVIRAVGVSDWAGFDLREALHETFDRESLVENDCALAAVAESWVGAGRHVSDHVTIGVGRSIGAGIIINGRLHRGFDGYAGEIHHLPDLPWSGAAELLRDRDGRLDIRSMFDRAGDGDTTAVTTVDRFAHALAQGIAVIAAVVDPELVILGGGLSQSGETLADPTRSHLDQMTTRKVRLVTSELGDRATALGALRRGLDQIEQNLAWVTEATSKLPPPTRRAVMGATAKGNGATGVPR